MAELDPAQLVVLTTCRDNVEAMGVRALLQAEGIEVLVQGEHHRAVEGSLLGAMIELRVMVRRADLEDARELLEEEKYAEHLPAEPDAGPIEDPSVLRFRERLADPDADLPLLAGRPSPRHPGVAAVLAVILPIGAGHLYARRPLRGLAIGLAMLVQYVLWLRGWWVLPAVVALMAADAVGSFVALRRDAAKATEAERLAVGAGA